jgi:hypothetical protein
MLEGRRLGYEGYLDGIQSGESACSSNWLPKLQGMQIDPIGEKHA